MKNITTRTIPADSIETVTERVNRVAKRAAKVGFPVPVLTLTDRRRVQKGTDASGAPIYVDVVDLSIDATDSLRLQGWEFVATVSAILSGGKEVPFVTAVPGMTIPDCFVPAKVNWCDHCKTVRQRTNTYIVRNVGEVKQVGSSCLKDFTGHGANEIVPYFEALALLDFDEDEVLGWFGSAVNWYKPFDIIALASRIVAKEAYCSKQKAEDENRSSTGELVRAFLTARGKEYNELSEAYPADDAAEALLNDTLAAIEASVSYNEWEADVVRLAKADGIQWRHVGILASSVILGLRKQERRAVSAAKGESNFIGKVGERITLPVKVTMKREFDGQFGPTYAIRMLANGTDDLLWFGSWSEATMAIKEGDEFTITGTIKKHELDKRSERPTTVLTRCKIAA